MKISELSAKSGVSVPTIKFYIREGLLPPGERTGRNQARYGARHVERLALIRALRDDAGLPLDTIARAVKAADSAKDDFVVAAIDAVASRKVPKGSARAPSRQAWQMLESAVERIGWDVSRKDLAMRDAAWALTTAMRSFPSEMLEDLMPYAEIADRIATHELPDTWDENESPEAALTYAVLGTVLFEPLILAMRRMAHVARSRKLAAQRNAR